MNLLMQYMNYLFFVHSIEQIDNTILENCLELDMQNNLQEDAEDFNYNELSIEEISDKIMPFINCNRKVFCNTGLDIIDLLKPNSIDLISEFYENHGEIITKLSFINSAIHMLSSKDINFKDIQAIACEHLDKSCKYPFSAKKLNEKLEELTECIIMHNLNMIKSNAYDFLLESEKSLGELSNINIFKLFFGIIPSALLNNAFAKKDLNVAEFKQLMVKINIVYKRANKYICRLKNVIFTKRNGSYILYSRYFIESIPLKWMIELERVCIINHNDKLEEFSHLLIYSINANDILIEELTKMIQNLISVKSDEERKLLGLIEITKIRSINLLKYSDYYEIELSNKKKYTIEMLNLEHYYNLPPGLSTTYLDCKNGFECFGFMGAVKISEDEFKYLFLSVEEKLNFYLSIRYFDIFKSNVIQAFYFILYVLDLFNSFNVHKIKLRYDFSFAVDSNDNKKWRFRLDNIGDYCFHENKDLYYYHWNIIHIFDTLLKVFDNQDKLNSFKNLKDIANKLKSNNNKDFFVILISIVKCELEDFQNKTELIHTNRYQCVVQ